MFVRPAESLEKLLNERFTQESGTMYPQCAFAAGNKFNVQGVLLVEQVVEQIAKEIANRAVEESEFMAHIKR